MASQADVQKVEIYTTNEPTQAKTVQYKGLVIASKVKSRNMFSDIGSGKFTTHLQSARINQFKIRRLVSCCIYPVFRVQVSGGRRGEGPV